MQPFDAPAGVASTFGRGALAIAGAVGLTVGLVLGAGAGVAGTVLATRGMVSGPEGESSPAEPVADVLAAELPRMQAFVEQFKGKSFGGTPHVEVLDDDAFEAELMAAPQSAPESGNVADLAATAAALGLTASAQDFEDASLIGTLEGTTGFYDPDDDVLYVRGTTWTPLVETTVVHELVHALQDQQADLAALTEATRDYDESWSALSALLEGEASFVESAYLAEQDVAFADELVAEQDRLWADVPSDPFADALGALPYDLGWEAVDRLYADGGPEAFAEALQRPPTTLEQLWLVEDWAGGAPETADPVELDYPLAPRGRRVVDRGALGAHVLAMLPLTADELYWLEDGPLDGWAGDAYTTWRQGSGSHRETCTTVDVRTDGDEAAAEVAERLEPWVDDGGEVSIGQGGVVSLTRCTAS